MNKLILFIRRIEDETNEKINKQTKKIISHGKPHLVQEWSNHNDILIVTKDGANDIEWAVKYINWTFD